ncbi:MltA domain-containing protein, partial [Pantoea sp. SIMBA_072]
AATCEAAGSDTASAAQVRTFLEQNLQVYGLRSAENNANGLITGYYEPVYPGSLKPTEANHVAVYGVPDDMIVVDLASVYPELKGKRLRG